MRNFFLGVFCTYLATGLLLAVMDGRGVIELFPGWLTNILCLPEILAVGIVTQLKYITETLNNRK